MTKSPHYGSGAVGRWIGAFYFRLDALGGPAGSKCVAEGGAPISSRPGTSDGGSMSGASLARSASRMSGRSTERAGSIVGPWSIEAGPSGADIVSSPSLAFIRLSSSFLRPSSARCSVILVLSCSMVISYRCAAKANSARIRSLSARISAKETGILASSRRAARRTARAWTRGRMRSAQRPAARAPSAKNIIGSTMEIAPKDLRKLKLSPSRQLAGSLEQLSQQHQGEDQLDGCISYEVVHRGLLLQDHSRSPSDA